MANLPGGQPVLDHDKMVRANDPRVREFVPAIAAPIQSANQTLEKVSITLNRAGTHKGNPILAGLAGRVQIPLATTDILTGLFVFTDRADPKGNLVHLVSGGPAGLRTFDLPMVEGFVSVGSPATGPRRNYLRQVSQEGKFERTFWVQSKDFNTVQLNGLPALDPDTLAPVAITVKRPNTVDAWIDVVADFFVAWADEFHVEHRSNNPNLDPGFAKAYGGSLVVSVFDTNPTPAEEGVGVEVNPYTEVLIAQQKKVQVQNTVGLKRFTFRFRAKVGSPFFVDCPVEVLVIEDDPCVCDPPTEANPPPDEEEPCVPPPIDYIPPTDPPTISPPEMVWSDSGLGLVPYSIEGVTPEQGIVTETLSEPVLVITVQGQAAGGSPTIRVRRWTFMPDIEAHDSVKLVFVNELEFIPLLVDGATCPTNDPPYQPADAYRIAFSRTQELIASIVFYEVFVDDGGLWSKAAAVLGPGMGQLAEFMIPGSGSTTPTAPT